MVILGGEKKNIHSKMSRSSERVFKQRDGVCIGEDIKPDAASNCFIWRGRNMIPCDAYPEIPSSRFEVSWMKNNMCFHTLAHRKPSRMAGSCSAEFTTRQHFKSLYVVSLTSNINITKIHSPGWVCGDWINGTGLLVLRMLKRCALLNHVNENNTPDFWLTGFHYSLVITSSSWPSRSLYLHGLAIYKTH